MVKLLHAARVNISNFRAGYEAALASPETEQPEGEVAFPPVERVECVDYSTGFRQPAAPLWRVRVGEYCADFETETAASNFRDAITDLISPPPEGEVDALVAEAVEMVESPQFQRPERNAMILRLASALSSRRALPDAEQLRALVRAKMADRSFRKVAPEAGVSPATLNRVARGRPPNLADYLKLLRWLSKADAILSRVEGKDQ